MGQWDLTATPPGVTNYNAADAGTAVAPGHTNPAALSNVAPGHADPAGLSGAAPGHTTPAALTTTPPGILNPDGSTPGVPSVPSVFIPSFIELTGGGNSLSTLNANAADAAAGKILQGTVGGALKSYQVRVGNDAQDLPGIVHPANHDDATNPVIFVQL